MSIAPLISTMEECADSAGIVEQGFTYPGSLQSTSGYRIASGQLDILGAGGNGILAHR